MRLFHDKLITDEEHTWRKANFFQLCNFNLLFFCDSTVRDESCRRSRKKNNQKRAINIEADGFCHVERTRCAIFCKPKQTKFHKSRETIIDEMLIELKTQFLRLN